jgi:hypothetical protein
MKIHQNVLELADEQEQKKKKDNNEDDPGLRRPT